MATKRAMNLPWVRQLIADRALLTRVAHGGRATGLGPAALRLADSRYAAQLDEVLARGDSGDGIELVLARGRRALVHERVDEAFGWLVRAQSLATARTPLLVGRIAFLVGAIHLGRDEEVATDAVLAWAEGFLGTKAEANADVLHVRALLAERRGERDAATALYRRVLQRANAALTPMTRVLAMRNLASTLAHSYPRESAGLYAIALATLDAEELDDAARSTLENGMGYALLCGGDVEGARLKLDQARDDARRRGNERVDMFAWFNIAIADELAGHGTAAETKLADVERGARAVGLEELIGWTWIRRAWLRLRAGDRGGASRILRSSFPGTPRTEHRDAIATLDALVHLNDRPTTSRGVLARLADSYAKHGDDLTSFTLRLWVAYADAQSGRVAAARRAVMRACALGAERGFRLGTSWWAPELAAIAREHATPELAEFAERLLSAGGPASETDPPDVSMTREGAVAVAGRTFEDADWREGRSGSGVLRRYFRVLLSAYPARLERDEIADLLWPESEGDKAVRNLYDATKDLRRVLSRVPGARLEVTDGRYGLALDRNVTVH